MKLIKLAYRNLIGAKLRTWLNVIVLSFAFVTIIWYKGLIDGWDRQAKRDMIAWEIGGGQYWQKNYDPYDPFTLDESHTTLPAKLQKAVDEKHATPILITQGSIYPEGRIQSIFIKGIVPSQEVIDIPCAGLTEESTEIPALIGKRMAKNCHLKEGDIVTIRWRDKNGTFDAREIEITSIFDSDVPTIDGGQIWIPLKRLQEMLQTPDEATLIVCKPGFEENTGSEEWVFKDQDYLLADFNSLIQAKSVGGSIFYVILLLLAMLAIFDTQVLSIFRRQREIGTMVALGMTRREVIWLFTFEGTLHAFLAVIIGAIYGIPLFIHQAKTGWAMPYETDDLGITIADVIYPVYSLGLIVGTIVIVTITTAIVSYIPARKISKMKPTDAIRGKLQ